MAREAGTGTRGETVSGAFPTMMASVTLVNPALLARVSLCLRKELLIEASHVESPAHGRARVASSEPLASRIQAQFC